MEGAGTRSDIDNVYGRFCVVAGAGEKEHTRTPRVKRNHYTNKKKEGVRNGCQMGPRMGRLPRMTRNWSKAHLFTCNTRGDNVSISIQSMRSAGVSWLLLLGPYHGVVPTDVSCRDLVWFCESTRSLLLSTLLQKNSSTVQ